MLYQTFEVATDGIFHPSASFLEGIAVGDESFRAFVARL